MSAAAAARKPPGTGRDAAGSPSPASPARAPARTSTPSSPGAAGGVARTRSLRGGTPVTSRTARASPLSNGTNGRSSPGPGGNPAEDEAARAETLSLIDDLKERLSKAETSAETTQRQAEVLQSKLDEAMAEQARLEERLHEQEEQIEALSNEKRESTRRIHEMESIYEAERSAMAKEKEEMGNREEEMQTVIQRLKDSLAQRNVNGADDESRPSRQATHSPGVDGSFAPPSSLQRSDSRNSSKLVLQKDKLIESLRLELAEAQIKLVESENQGGGRLQEVERLLMETRMANARLLEDNESYQLLLQERTLKGDFGRSIGGGGASDALAALEGRTGSSHENTGGSSLADELSEASNSDEAYRRLEVELRSARDENKALTLYINKIIERLLQRADFESILNQDGDTPDFKPANTNKELPAPPASGPTLLQRAKSIAMGKPGDGPAPGKPRPRPMSFMPSNTQPSSAHANPETAPSIPIGLTRNTSVRRGGRPMSEQFTSGAASVVNQMYRGGEGGPLSPTLRGNQTFFHPGTPSAGTRTPSGSRSSVPMSSSGNFPGMRSETSSTSGESIHQPADTSSLTSNSPPRSGGGAGATFGGNKPRPLRLVQENPDISASQQNKRASWIGWAFGKKDENSPSLAGETVKE
ncbi:hypothetical protein MCOR25_008703 [Pyricularia grisea]|uniref:M protein, serotype 2.1 n=1 Tax=Pyricularia grisea TaxID=148305 RepID=A0A6P8ASZ5_PYRGI|nr:uncharacterized protein PgNI_09673 [Pyricularia grisea]KAI6354194.1 hypothetical protein MCOR25_008703 [Pyricularia grisea]TLD05222.1 hypothetical protein PgNI_09673 [Pyricularia grisea]